MIYLDVSSSPKGCLYSPILRCFGSVKDKRNEDTHQLGRNEHEHETQSCQLEKNGIDQGNRSDQKQINADQVLGSDRR